MWSLSKYTFGYRRFPSGALVVSIRYNGVMYNRQIDRENLPYREAPMEVSIEDEQIVFSFSHLTIRAYLVFPKFLCINLKPQIQIEY
jgi:hypothetical protein